MKIAKTFVVNAPLDAVWAFITSPASVAPCIPGCTGATQIDETHFKATVALAIGPIKTAFNVAIEQTEVIAPKFARYEVKGDEGGQASRVKSESTLRLEALGPDSTQVAYQSDVTIVGRLGKFGAGLVQKKADAIGDEFVAALKSQLEKADGDVQAVPIEDEVSADVIPASVQHPMPWSRLAFGGLMLIAVVSFYLSNS